MHIKTNFTCKPTLFLDWKYVFFLFSLIILGCGPKVEPIQPVAKAEAATVKKVKAPLFELRDLEGQKVSLKEMKGKVVFIDFWATWCPPCIVSAPAIEKLAEDYKNKKVEIISVSLDQNEEAVRRFVRQLNLKSRVAMAGDSLIDLQYQVSSLPAFFLIDQEGYVVSVWNGYHPSLVAVWKKEMDRLLET